MSLNLAQKNFITSSIEHLLDFSSDKLEEQIAKLLQALSSTVPDTHDYYFLRKCLIQTDEMLLGIEKFNKNISLGEIQSYIIHLIFEKIKEASSDNLEIYNALCNHLEPIIAKLIPDIHQQTRFISNATPTAMEHFPWQNMHEEGQIYTTSLLLIETGEIILQLEMNFPHQEIKHFPFDNIENAGDSYQNIYLNNLIPQAKARANEIMADIILQYLYNMNRIDKETYDSLIINSYTYPILTNRFYLWNFINDNINVGWINDVSEEESASLINPSVIHLLQNNYCDLEDAIELSPIQRILVTSYLQAIKKQHVKIKDILDINEDQAKILLQPLIINLINQDPAKLSFALAKQIPKHLKKLFCNPLYMDFLATKEIQWDKFIQLGEEDCNVLQEKYIAALIANHVINFHSFSELAPELIGNFARERINKLLCEKIISIDDLKNASLNQILLIDKHPHLYDWLRAGIIKINEIDPNHLINLYSKVYTQRLTALLQKIPFIICNKIDSAEQIHTELTMAIPDETNFQLLKEAILKQVIQQMMPKIESLVLYSLPNKERKKLLQTLQEIEHPSIANNPFTWSYCLAELMGYARQILANPQARRIYDLRNIRSSFFSSPNYLAQVEAFCNGLCAMDGLKVEKVWPNETTLKIKRRKLN